MLDQVRFVFLINPVSELMIGKRGPAMCAQRGLPRSGRPAAGRCRIFLDIWRPSFQMFELQI